MNASYLLQLLNRPNANVLKAVLNAPDDVRNEFVNRASVTHRRRYSLCHFDCVRFTGKKKPF